MLNFERERESYEALGSKVTKSEVAIDDLGGVEEVEGSSIMAAEKESLSQHVDIGGLLGKGGNFIGEEDGGGVEVLGDAVPHHRTKLVRLLLSHFQLRFELN